MKRLDKNWFGQVGDQAQVSQVKDQVGKGQGQELDNIFAYAHINIKHFDFTNDFYLFESAKLIKTQENWKILNKTRSIYSKFY